jgi:hypothetical protein
MVDGAAGLVRPVRCDRCGDLIGAYELILVREDGRVRETSLAAEPQLRSAQAEEYHLECTRR